MNQVDDSRKKGKSRVMESSSSESDSSDSSDFSDDSSVTSSDDSGMCSISSMSSGSDSESDGNIEVPIEIMNSLLKRKG